jgi:spore germination cell wall hydrolase CwlJ-like protein
MQKRTPEGWLAVAVIVLANLILIILLIILGIWILFIPKEEETETPIFEEDAIPLEEMFEHDLAFAYAKWEYQQIEETKPMYVIDVTEEDIQLMTRVVMSEVGSKVFDCKHAVAQTIVNRVRSGKWGNTVSEVVYWKKQYSTQDNGEPNAECRDAVIQALTYEAFPLNMYYFREDHYHDFGSPYTHIDGTYFSTEKTAWD